ncbi:hypothetical protein GH714_017503 [Hevea brasiliensis]|uniref:Uncharacterized protein n=1 Tax=Hevea brasiliensis TaxID=3981 RepID=A0A6A6LAH6_HEVBR|nr:hypothetical protein GH714_017503 [Hevea brasiliensis]
MGLLRELDVGWEVEGGDGMRLREMEASPGSFGLPGLWRSIFKGHEMLVSSIYCPSKGKSLGLLLLTKPYMMLMVGPSTSGFASSLLKDGRLLLHLLLDPLI